MTWRAVVFGYGIVGEACLRTVLELGVDVRLICTHRPPPNDFQEGLVGRAARLGIPALEDPDLRSDQLVERLRAAQPDVLLCFYGKELLPTRVLKTARLGGVNLHGSLLPRYRGRAPVNWMVIHGETRGGVTLHRMYRRPDAGPILASRPFSIGPDDTGYDVLLKVLDHGVALLRECLLPYLEGRLVPVPQSGPATTFGRRTPEMGEIDCRGAAVEVNNLVRAVTRPYPGAFVRAGERTLFIWKTAPQPDAAPAPGTLLVHDGRVLLGTGTYALALVDASFAPGTPAGWGLAEVRHTLAATGPWQATLPGRPGTEP